MSLIQSAGTASNAGTNPAITLTETLSGSTIVVCGALGGAWGGVPIDNKSNIYVQGMLVSPSYHNLTIWYCANATAGVTEITLNTGANTSCAALAIEEGGLLAAPFDQTAGKQTTSPFTSGNTGTLAQANEVCYGAASHGSTGETWTAGSGWAAVATVSNTLYGGDVFVERQVVTATTALAATGTCSAGSGSYDAAIATFKVSSGPGAPPPQPSPFAIGASLILGPLGWVISRRNRLMRISMAHRMLVGTGSSFAPTGSGSLSAASHEQ